MRLKDTRFRDIAERENKALDALTYRLDQFRQFRKKRKFLTPAEKRELDLIKQILRRVEDTADDRVPEVADPLFVAARKLFNDGAGMLSHELLSHSDGVFVFRGNPSSSATTKAALTLGLMLAEGTEAPPVMVLDEDPNVTTDANLRIVPNESDPAWATLTHTYFCAIGKARGMADLAALVLPLLAVEGDPDGAQGPIAATVDTYEFGAVMEELSKRGVTTDENQLRRRVNEALDHVQSVGERGPTVNIGINLPDLEEISDNDIVAENVRLMGPMIVSAMFDELKAFQAVDLLVERWRDGTLPIGSGEAGSLLYRYWREAPNRISEMERRSFYAITMGVPGGDNVERHNREFNDLWIRCVSSVSEFVRQAEVDKLLRTSLPHPVHHQQVRKSCRDLANNLSLHGYGMAYYAAIELQEQIKFMIRLLSDPEVRSSYGARDMWQVIDNIATVDLGGARNSSRYRTLATCGTIITAWLASNVHRINAATGALLDVDEIRHPTPKLSGQKATTHPNDYDLVNACELWLADTAISDTRVEELSQPREAPVQTSQPIHVPGVVRDMLDGMGNLGIGMGHAR